MADESLPVHDKSANAFKTPQHIVERGFVHLLDNLSTRAFNTIYRAIRGIKTGVRIWRLCVLCLGLPSFYW